MHVATKLGTSKEKRLGAHGKARRADRRRERFRARACAELPAPGELRATENLRRVPHCVKLQARKNVHVSWLFRRRNEAGAPNRVTSPTRSHDALGEERDGRDMRSQKVVHIANEQSLPR